MAARSSALVCGDHSVSVRVVSLGSEVRFRVEDRENTERPITVSLGTNKLIGTKYERIPGEITAVLRNNLNKHSIPNLWDGKSSDRISKVIESYFYPNIRN